jgi:hypothetical protein
MIKIRLNQTRCTGSRFINENERHSRSRDPKSRSFRTAFFCRYVRAEGQ